MKHKTRAKNVKLTILAVALKKITQSEDWKRKTKRPPENEKLQPDV